MRRGFVSELMSQMIISLQCDSALHPDKPLGCMVLYSSPRDEGVHVRNTSAGVLEGLLGNELPRCIASAALVRSLPMVRLCAALLLRPVIVGLIADFQALKVSRRPPSILDWLVVLGQAISALPPL